MDSEKIVSLRHMMSIRSHFMSISANDVSDDVVSDNVDSISEFLHARIHLDAVPFFFSLFFCLLIIFWQRHFSLWRQLEEVSSRHRARGAGSCTYGVEITDLSTSFCSN